MVVVDTSVLVYLYVRGERTAQAEGVLTRDPVWAAPILWRSEFRNGLVGLVRTRVLALALDLARRLVEEAEGRMRGHEYAVVSDHVLQLAAESRCSAYDCEFVALAQGRGVSLVTSDREVLAGFPGTAIAPDAFAR